MSGEPLVCSGCGAAGPPDERFCDACGMPLVIADIEGLPEPTERQERARKTKKQYSEGPLIRVAVGRHQAEAELIQGLLLEHGVPSMYKRSAGFDVPDMLFSGPRDVFVPQSGEAVAREVLAEVETEHAAGTTHQGQETRTEPQQGGLPGPVGAAEQYDFAFFDPQCRAGEGGELSEHGNCVIEFHDGHGRHARS